MRRMGTAIKSKPAWRKADMILPGIHALQQPRPSEAVGGCSKVGDGAAH
jgi:hypothetical protein